MDQKAFNKRFLSIRAKLLFKFSSYKDVWSNIGTSSLDQAFIELSSLYLEADDNQKAILVRYCGKKPVIIESLWQFIRRVGYFINTDEDKRWFEIGLAAAMLDACRFDFRDTVISLVLLRFIAERRGIETKTIFDKFIEISEGHTREALKNARDHSEADILYTLRNCGSSEWVMEYYSYKNAK